MRASARTGWRRIRAARPCRQGLDGSTVGNRPPRCGVKSRFGAAARSLPPPSGGLHLAERFAAGSSARLRAGCDIFDPARDRRAAAFGGEGPQLLRVRALRKLRPYTSRTHVRRAAICCRMVRSRRDRRAEASRLRRPAFRVRIMRALRRLRPERVRAIARRPAAPARASAFASPPAALPRIKKIPGPMQIGLGIEQGSKAAPYEYMKRLILPFGVLAKGSFISS